MTVHINQEPWADSTVEEIRIESDRVDITVFHSARQMTVHISCSQCVGISQALIWDEIILEDITMTTASDGEPIVQLMRQLYGNINYDSAKSPQDQFYKLSLKFLNVPAIDIICKNIVCQA